VAISVSKNSAAGAQKKHMVENITFSHLFDCWWKKRTHKKKNSPLKTPEYLYPVIACFSVAITWPKPWVSSSKKMTTTLGALASKVSEMPCKTGGIHAKFTRIHPSMVQVVSQLFSGGFWMVFLHPLEKCEKQSAETVWWFPKTGRPPIIIHLWMDFP
jgi:hypothetical protein